MTVAGDVKITTHYLIVTSTFSVLLEQLNTIRQIIRNKQKKGCYLKCHVSIYLQELV